MNVCARIDVTDQPSLYSAKEVYFCKGVGKGHYSNLPSLISSLCAFDLKACSDNAADVMKETAEAYWAAC